ncbi:acid protease [Dichomitus squalens]|uniref:Acid protease n=1 Tax=Dichomitus squalens TaxID=114155 RepID=A0A4Q9QF89_9APHY|nr:acid protease [Dichomitus squalens]
MVCVGLTVAFVAYICASVCAKDAVKIPLKRSGSRAMQNVVKRDISRFAPRPELATVPVANDAINYLANVTVGTQTFYLLVDTGSANTWVGANKTYIPGDLGYASWLYYVEVTYGSGYFNGTEYFDTVIFGGLTVHNQSIGVSSYEEGYGYQGLDGILGVGAIIQTNGTVNGTELVPTVMDNLYAQGVIEEEVLGVYFAPLSRNSTLEINGELTIGGVDDRRYIGNITYVPTWKSGDHVSSWGLNVDSIVDTGTTNIYIPESAYTPFLNVSGGTYDYNVHLSKFAAKPTGNFAFSIGGTLFELTPDQYLVPQDEYSVWNIPDDGNYYSFISTAGPTYFFIGQKFLENYYAVFDTTNVRIGLAPATHSS